MSWLDRYFIGGTISLVQWAGVAQPLEPILNFTGAGVTVADDPTNSRTTITIGAYSLTGDVAGTPSGSSIATVIGAISGASPLPITPSSLAWLAATSSPTLTQATPTTAVAPANITLAPQLPYASAGTIASGTPGSLVVSLGTPVGPGGHGFLNIVDSGTTYFTLGVVAGLASIYLGNTAAAPLSTTFQIASDGQTLQFMGANPLGAAMRINSTVTTHQNWQLLSNLSAPGNPSGGCYAYGIGGALTSKGSGGATTTVASAGSGTVNSQQMAFGRVTGACRTAAGSTAAATVLSFPLATGHCADTLVRVSGRCTAAGTSGMNVGDVFSTVLYALFNNPSGTPGLVGSGSTVAAIAANSSSTMNQCTVSYTFSANNVNVIVTPVYISSAAAIGQIDWQCSVTPYAN